MLPLELGELQENPDTDFASVKTVQGQTFIVLPYRTTGLGAYRAHYMQEDDDFPESAYDWRERGVSYLAFPYNNQRIVSLYCSNSGILRVQVIEPTPWEKPKVTQLGSTSEAAACRFTKDMVQITRW
jgi:hypothetical protein